MIGTNTSHSCDINYWPLRTCVYLVSLQRGTIIGWTLIQTLEGMPSSKHSTLIMRVSGVGVKNVIRVYTY